MRDRGLSVISGGDFMLENNCNEYQDDQNYREYFIHPRFQSEYNNEDISLQRGG